MDEKFTEISSMEEMLGDQGGRHRGPEWEMGENLILRSEREYAMGDRATGLQLPHKSGSHTGLIGFQSHPCNLRSERAHPFAGRQMFL